MQVGGQPGAPAVLLSPLPLRRYSEMEASRLEALRLQALQSLKLKRPTSPPVFGSSDSNKSHSGSNSEIQSIMNSSSTEGVSKNVNKKNQKKGKKKKTRNRSRDPSTGKLLKPWMLPAKKGLHGHEMDDLSEDYEPQQLSPSTQIFTDFTNRLLDQTLLPCTMPKSGNTKFEPPPSPGSFKVHAKPNVIRCPIINGPIIIDLDVFTDSEDRQETNCKKEDMALERANNSLSPANPSQFQSVETELANVKTLLENLEKAYVQNEKVISDAIAKQTELRTRLKQYKSFIQQAKTVKSELAKKKTQLLSRLIIARHNADKLEIKLRTTPDLVDTEIASSSTLKKELIVEGIEQPVKKQEFTSGPQNLVEENPNILSKRKNEMAELEKQLNRVQKDLQQSKLYMLNSKILKRAKLETAIENLPVRSPALVVADLWRFLEDILPPDAKSYSSTVQRSEFDAYESPLKWFKSSIFFSHFIDLCSKKGIMSTTFTNKIDPFIAFCKEEFEYGCSNKSCKFQHFSQIQQPDDKVLESIVERLLEFSPKDTFESKADVLEYIQGKLGGADHKGVPAVSLVAKLIALKSEISKDVLSIKPLRDFETASSAPLMKSDVISLKLFLKSMAEIGGRYFLAKTESLLSGSCYGSNRYYTGDCTEKNTNLFEFLQDIAEDLKVDVVKGKIQDRFTSCHPGDTRTRAVLLDIMNALSIETPSVTDFSDPLCLWLVFLSCGDFTVRSSIAGKLLMTVADADEYVQIVMGVAKSAMDASMDDEVKSLFLAVLMSQMSISHEDILPCAQLCAPSVELSSLHKCYLYLFYLEYLQFGTYSSQWFLQYPYDSCANISYRPVLSWDAKGELDESAKILEGFLEDPIAGPLAAYNLLSMLLARGQNVLSASMDLKSIPQFVIQSLTLTSLPAESNGITRVAHCMKLWSSGFQILARNILSDTASGQLSGNSELDEFAGLFRDPSSSSVDAWLKNRTSTLAQIGRYALFKDPFLSCGANNLPILKRLNEMNLEWRLARSRLIFSVDTNIDSFFQALLTDPSDSGLWKSLLALIESTPMLQKYLQQCIDAAMRFCSAHAIGHTSLM